MVLIMDLIIEENEAIKSVSSIKGQLAASYRIQMFGHAAHTIFETTSQEYVVIPGTECAGISLPSVAEGANRYFRIELSFAGNHDDLVWLRSFDSANSITDWELKFKAGHYPIKGWSWGTTPRIKFFTTPHLPWQRQHHLELKTDDSRGVKLGGAWVVVEDIIE